MIKLLSKPSDSICTVIMGWAAAQAPDGRTYCKYPHAQIISHSLAPTMCLNMAAGYDTASPNNSTTWTPPHARPCPRWNHAPDATTRSPPFLRHARSPRVSTLSRWLSVCPNYGSGLSVSHSDCGTLLLARSRSGSLSPRASFVVAMAERLTDTAIYQLIRLLPVAPWLISIDRE